MVLIAAAVCNKTGKAIISRQFVELTKSRIEVFKKRKAFKEPGCKFSFSRVWWPLSQS